MTSTADVLPVTPERALTEARLLRNVARLSELLDNATLASATPRERSVVADFRALFAEEIADVRRIRNAVAHAQTLDDSVVEDAARASAKLVSLAEWGLEHKRL